MYTGYHCGCVTPAERRCEYSRSNWVQTFTHAPLKNSARYQKIIKTPNRNRKSNMASTTTQLRNDSDLPQEVQQCAAPSTHVRAASGQAAQQLHVHSPPIRTAAEGAAEVMADVCHHIVKTGLQAETNHQLTNIISY